MQRIFTLLTFLLFASPALFAQAGNTINYIDSFGALTLNFTMEVNGRNSYSSGTGGDDIRVEWSGTRWEIYVQIPDELLFTSDADTSPNPPDFATGNWAQLNPGEALIRFDGTGTQAAPAAFAFTPTQPVTCVDAGIQTELGGGTPTGGTYSGTGVTDDGNGMTYTFDPSIAGAGMVAITYGNGGAMDATAMVTVGELMSVPLGSVMIPEGESITYTLDPMVSGGSGNYNYDWGDGVVFGATVTLTPFADGNLNLLVTDNVTGCQLRDTFFYTFGTLLSGDMCVNAFEIDSLLNFPQGQDRLTSLVNNTDATTEGDPATGFECFGEPDGGGAGPSLEKTLWFTFVGDGNTYKLRTVECSATDYIDDGDTQMVVYSGDCGNLTSVACNEDAADVAPAGPYPAEIAELPTEVGVTYYIMIDGFNFNGSISDGEFCLQVTNLSITSVTDLQNTNFSVYPNPTTGMIQLEGLNVEHVDVFDQTGRRAVSFQQPGFQIDLQGLPAGVYFLRIADGAGGIYSARVMKK